MKKIIIILMIAIVGGGIFGYYMYNKPVADISDLRADFVLNADALFTAFNEDESAANNNYLGKIIEVSGIVRDINTDAQGSSIIFETSDPIFGINCGLSAGQDDLFGKIKTGDTVTLRGECAGYDMDVVLTRCVIVN